MKFKTRVAWTTVLVVGGLCVFFWAQKTQTDDVTSTVTENSEGASASSAPQANLPQGRKPASVAAQESTGPQANLTREQVAELDKLTMDKIFAQRAAFRARVESLIASGNRTVVSFRLRSGDFRLVPRAYAVSGRLAESGDYEILEKRPNETFIYLKPEATVPAGASPVVFNSQRGTLAAVTGGITVTLNGNANLSALASTYNMELVFSFPDQKLAFFKGNSQRLEDLLPLAKEVSEDPSVASAEIEVKEKFYVAQ